VNTIMPEYFPPRIKRALQKRKNKEKGAVAPTKFMIRSDIYEALRNSSHVSKGKSFILIFIFLEQKSKTLLFKPRKRTTGQFLRDNQDVADARNRARLNQTTTTQAQSSPQRGFITSRNPRHSHQELNPHLFSGQTPK
jgi:hypothetical protein